MSVNTLCFLRASQSMLLAVLGFELSPALLLLTKTEALRPRRKTHLLTAQDDGLDNEYEC